MNETAPVVDVRLEGISKSFGRKRNKVTVLDELSLDVSRGEMLVLLGPSGCGKTTLLRCVAGLEQADTGRIVLGDTTVADAGRGVFVSPDKRGIGMVFQNYALWPHMTVEKNVAFPLRARGQAAAIADGRVQEALEIVQCGHLAKRYPPQLSGGQQQRVSLARALASRPKVMLMDEPLSNLDALLRIDLRAQLHQLHENLGFTGIYVTHDQAEAMSLGTRVVVMRSGKIEQIGPPESIYNNPKNEYVAEFLGMRNRLAGTVSETGQLEIGGNTGVLPSNTIASGRYILRSRPAQIRMAAAGAPTEEGDSIVWFDGATITDRMVCGEMTEYIVRLGEDTILVEDREDLKFQAGTAAKIGFRLDHMRFYGADEGLVENRFSAG